LRSKRLSENVVSWTFRPVLQFYDCGSDSNSMANNWSYYNEQGDKISVTSKELKALAKSGKITPGTMIESPDGKAAPAKKVKGLCETKRRK